MNTDTLITNLMITEAIVAFTATKQQNIHEYERWRIAIRAALDAAPSGHGERG